MTQPELPIGDSCPEHGHEYRNLGTLPVGNWNSHAPELTDRYRDTVYRCDGKGRNGSSCSWASSAQLGTFCPPGLDSHRVNYAEMYHEKRYRPRKWAKRHLNPRPAPKPTTRTT